MFWYAEFPPYIGADNGNMFWMRKIRLLACFAVMSGMLACASGTPERQISEWIIREGGRVMVNGQRGVIDDVAKLLAAPFRLTAVDLIGTTIDPEDLSKLGGLAASPNSLFPIPIFTPFSDSPLDANALLKLLSCKTGRSLGCRWHFGNLGILEGHDLPLRLFLYDDQGRARLYFARFIVFLKLHVR